MCVGPSISPKYKNDQVTHSVDLPSVISTPVHCTPKGKNRTKSEHLRRDCWPAVCGGLVPGTE